MYRWYNNQWHTCLIFYVPVFSFRAPAVCIVRTVDTIFTSCLPWELRTSISYFQQKVTSSAQTQLFRFFSHIDCKTTIWTDNSTCSNSCPRGLVQVGHCCSNCPGKNSSLSLQNAGFGNSVAISSCVQKFVSSKIICLRSGVCSKVVAALERELHCRSVINGGTVAWWSLLECCGWSKPSDVLKCLHFLLLMNLI